MVTVIGGGPAGATCAYYLAKAGIDVTMYEARPKARKPCGGGIALETLREFGKDLLTTQMRNLNPIKNVQIEYEGRDCINLGLDHPGAYILDRLKFDRGLRAAAKRGGCRIVKKLVQPSDIDDDIIVDARGACPSESVAKTVSSICKLRCRPDMARFAYYSRFNLIGYLWMFPLSDKLVNVGVGEMMRERFGGLEAAYEWWVDELDAKPVWKSAWFENLEIPRRLVTTGRGKTLVRIGERAGLVHPITGGGIHLAMESGKLVAECVADGGHSFSKYESHVARLKSEFEIYKKIRNFVFLPTLKWGICKAACKYLEPSVASMLGLKG